MSPVPVGVVGAGNMGQNHVRVYEGMANADLVAVVEPDEARAREVRTIFDGEVLKSVSDLSETGVEAVSICVPNRLHRSVGVECSQLGLDMLVEKPLALTIADAQAIVDTASERDLILQVGHIERFNPAVTTLEEILESEEVIAMEAYRLGPFSEHLTDESVVFDLMIHDLDVMTALNPTGLEKINASGVAPRSAGVDHAVALLKFKDGVIGTATASHVTHGKIRKMSVTTTNVYIRLDYQQQDIVVQRRGVERTEPLLDRGGYRTESITESPYIRTREPLKIELEHFIECCTHRARPMVDGVEGLEAVKLATNVVSQLSVE